MLDAICPAYVQRQRFRLFFRVTPLNEMLQSVHISTHELKGIYVQRSDATVKLAMVIFLYGFLSNSRIRAGESSLLDFAECNVYTSTHVPCHTNLE